MVVMVIKVMEGEYFGTYKPGRSRYLEVTWGAGPGAVVRRDYPSGCMHRNLL